VKDWVSTVHGDHRAIVGKEQATGYCLLTAMCHLFGVSQC